RCGLVHRRLRIIDLSPAGAQPMSNEDGRVQVVFNGEIYNFKPLREQLLAAGHVFRSRSDTEVLVHGWEQWGKDLLPKLRGMFAFAIWDDHAGQLVLGRDHIGKKPLFYWEQPNTLAFGSELDVFKALPDFSPQLSQAAFEDYMEFGYVPGKHSLFQGVLRLPPQSLAVFSQQHGLKIERYGPAFPDPHAQEIHGSAEETANALESILHDSVLCRLESDVPLGCFLSGGVDSSLVSAVAQECMGSRLKTYTVGFEDVPQSEAAHARQVAERLGSEHHELQVSQSSVLKEFEQILINAPEPLGDDSYVPTYLISRETRRHVTVVLSGDGGDEMFAGYEKYRQFAKAAPWMRAPLPWQWLSRLAWKDSLHKGCAAIGTGSDMELARWLSSLWKRSDLAQTLVKAGVKTGGDDVFETTWHQNDKLPTLQRWMVTDIATYLEGDILVKVDRANMAVALEGRAPLLDQEWIRNVVRRPLRADLQNGGKRILKQMLSKRFPIEWFERPKQGFGMPVEQWFRGELKETLRRYTDPARIRKRGLLRPEAITAAVENHLSGRRNFARKLYAVVAFEMWADRVFGGEGSNLRA
ncbi:MAG: asparagine synthase (glutamine-hydrolyzing), partial [Verrucomicrobia bacterium]|nr:asparagine synthase (glutamine-hydrolyzing) [Verrucomicrobiota bacterium]